MPSSLALSIALLLSTSPCTFYCTMLNGASTGEETDCQICDPIRVAYTSTGTAMAPVSCLVRTAKTRRKEADTPVTLSFDLINTLR